MAPSKMHGFSSFHMAVSMECFHDHCLWAAERKTAAFGEEMLIFYTAISKPFFETIKSVRHLTIS
jgi:hypothetical protein